MPPQRAEPSSADATAIVPPVRPEPADATRALPPVPRETPAPDEFGGRPMYRDEVRRGQDDSDGDTAEIDISAMDGAGRGQWWPPSRPVLLTAGFVALLLLAGGGAFLIATSGSGSDAGLAASTDAYDPERVASEETDPDPLDPAVLFSQETIELSGGATFTLVDTHSTEDCAEAAHGGYGEVLAENGCRQVVRASYVEEGGEYAVTVGVAALATAEAAEAAQEGQDIGATEWFAGFAGPEDSGAENLGHAGGFGNGAKWGRYLVFSLATTSDGQTPSNEQGELAEIGEEFVQVPLGPLGERALD